MKRMASRASAWFPTHRAKGARWMGHAAPFVARGSMFPTLTARAPVGMGHPVLGASVLLPTHRTKDVRWMGHAAAFVAGGSMFPTLTARAPVRMGHPNALWV